MGRGVLQVWELVHDERAHRVEVSGSVSHRVEWWVDGETVGTARSSEEKVVVEPDGEGADGLGFVAVRFSALGGPRRATLASSRAEALSGLGGVDLEPEAGSPAEAYEERLRAHPRRHAVLAGVGGVGKVVVPIVLLALLGRLVVAVDWSWLPDLPDLPSLPSLPLPSIPTPDWSLPDWSLPPLPAWLRWVLDHAKYVVPVLVAVALAVAEVRRRRDQDRRRAEARDADRPD